MSVIKIQKVIASSSTKSRSEDGLRSLMSEAATTAATTTRVNRDWEERDFVEMMQLNVLKITEFLNRFDTSTRYRLAKLDEKLAKLERTMDVVEASMRPREDTTGE